MLQFPETVIRAALQNAHEPALLLACKSSLSPEFARFSSSR
jgi:hypothetical protein